MKDDARSTEHAVAIESVTAQELTTRGAEPPPYGDRRGALIVAALLVLAILAAIGFGFVYALTASTQLIGMCLWIGFGALGLAFVLWNKLLMAPEHVVDLHEELPSRPETRSEAEIAFIDGGQSVVGRRPWLVRLLFGALGLVGVSALVPVLSFTPQAPAGPLLHTRWRKGMRAVREDGTVVKAADVPTDSIITVFPEEAVRPKRDILEMTNGATVLLHVEPSSLKPPTRLDWAPNGILAYSKICTHAGCPVGLYRARANQLYCPCHHSTFDVLAGCTVEFGPAPKPLPQLPIGIDADGTIVALDDFPVPIGPEFWEEGT